MIGKIYLSVLPFLFLAPTSHAAEYIVDIEKSSIAFTGQQAGTDFKGTFEKWNATIDFDREKPEKSKFNVTIDTDSAHTGNAMYDGTLPQDDWFKSKEFPKATFKSTSVSLDKGGVYKVDGDLTIRDVTKPISFTFTLSPEDAETKRVSASSSFQVDRLQYELGVKSDPKAEWVSKDIKMDMLIVAVPKA